MSHARFIFARLFALLLLTSLGASAIFAAGQLPPKPDRYFTDRAGIVDAAKAEQLNHELADFERETSDQLLVAIFQKVPDGFDRDGFTVQTAHAWGVGQHEKNNGAILFVFVDDHYVRIEVGYGLEPVLTDATCSLIIRDEIVPAFRAGNYTGGIDAAVHAMMQATRGEFRGNGATVTETSGMHISSHWFVVILVVLLWIFGWIRQRFGRRYPQRYGGSRWDGHGGWFIGGGDSDSGGSSSGSNDRFSSGGGDFGGGGAGGSW